MFPLLSALMTLTLPATLPSGAEEGSLRGLQERIPGARRTPLGSLVASFGSESGGPRTLVVVPLDAPGFVVSDVTPDGYLRLHGAYRRPPHPLFAQMLEGRPVAIAAAGGRFVPGAVLARSTHLSRGRAETAPAPPVTLDDLFVDVGAESAEEVEALGIALLDPVVPPEHGRALAALQDALAEGAAALAREAPPAPVTLVWAAQESLGRKGTDEALRTLGPFQRLVYLVPDLPAGDAPDAAYLSTSSALAGARVVDAPPLPGSRPAPGVGTEAAAPGFAGSGDREPEGMESIVAGPVVRYPWTPAERVAPESLAALVRGVLDVAIDGGRAARASGEPAPPPPPAEGPEAARTLAALVAALGVSGHEAPVREAVRSLLPAWARERAREDASGNLLVEVGPPGAPLAALFVAHLDEIGWVVKDVVADGSATLEKRGGFFDSLFEGARVSVETSGGRARAFVLPRDGYRDAAERDPRAGELRLSAVAGVRPGDPVVPERALLRLGRHRVAARTLDDRVGCTALVEALRALDPRDFDRRGRRVVFAWSVREEVGLVGAKALCEDFRPAAVFPVDTFVSSDSPRESPRFARAALGGGAVVRALDHSSATPREARERAMAIARRHGIPVRAGITGGGNDGSVFTRYGAVDVPLSWPLRSSHSSAEVADLRDIDALSRLIAALAIEY